MNRVAIAFSTKNRLELSKQSLPPLLQQNKFDLFWLDGSDDHEAKKFANKFKKNDNVNLITGVHGGSGAAIVRALTEMLRHPYEYVGLVENDVLLPRGWFDLTMLLWQRGRDEGITVGAVSTRTYEDRMLLQRDGFGIMHNLGAGMVIFSRAAAQLVLNTYRTQWTTENRMTFVQLTSNDIGSYWAFAGSEHWLCADWRWDAVLAANGYASLAPVPSFVEMIGQVPPLEQQGLTICKSPMEGLINDKVFNNYRTRLNSVRKGITKISTSGLFQHDALGGQMIFAHQIGALGGVYEGDWRLKDSIGFGPFGWRATNDRCTVTIPVLGPCAVFVSGGPTGAQAEILDDKSGFQARPALPPEGPQGAVVPVAVPVSISYRPVTVKALTPGVTFYGVRCRDPQPAFTEFEFSHATLPPV